VAQQACVGLHEGFRAHWQRLVDHGVYTAYAIVTTKAVSVAGTLALTVAPHSMTASSVLYVGPHTTQTH